MDIMNMANMPRKVLERTAFLYCNIWKEPPWNENFWNPDIVIKDIETQLSFPLFKGYVMVGCRKPYSYEKINLCRVGALGYSESDIIEPVGFTWGYETDVFKLQMISGVSRIEWEKVIQNKRIFYVDELGVASEHRGKGFGKELTLKLLEKIFCAGVTRVTLRTDKKADAARILYQKLGFVEIPITDAEFTDRTYWLLLL